MTVMEAYQSVRERAENKLAGERSRQAGKVRIRMQLGICSMAVEAREVYQVLEEMGSTRGQGNVVLTRTGCGGFCSLEPLVEVNIPGQKPVIYYHVTPEKARLIYLNHIEQGRVILPWTLAEGT